MHFGAGVSGREGFSFCVTGKGGKGIIGDISEERIGRLCGVHDAMGMGDEFTIVGTRGGTAWGIGVWFNAVRRAARAHYHGILRDCRTVGGLGR